MVSQKKRGGGIGGCQKGEASIIFWWGFVRGEKRKA